MKNNYADKFYEFRNLTLKPVNFASWAMPKKMNSIYHEQDF